MSKLTLILGDIKPTFKRSCTHVLVLFWKTTSSMQKCLLKKQRANKSKPFVSQTGLIISCSEDQSKIQFQIYNLIILQMNIQMLRCSVRVNNLYEVQISCKATCDFGQGHSESQQETKGTLTPLFPPSPMQWLIAPDKTCYLFCYLFKSKSSHPILDD